MASVAGMDGNFTPERSEVSLLYSYAVRLRGRFTPQEAARMLLKTQTMDEIRRVGMQLGLTSRQAHQERLRLFHQRYGV